LDAWNNHQDRQTAVAANELAILHATSPELKQRLAEDKSTLQQQSTHHLDGSGWQRTNAKEKSSSVNPGMVFLVIVGILVVWGVIGSCNSTNDSPHSTTYDSHTPSAPAYTPPAPSAPAYTPPPASDGGNSGGNVYRVPSDVSSALDREKAGIEADRAVLKQLDDQLDSLGRKIESDRIYLDKTSQDDVDAFNAKVDRYNTLSQQDKAATAAFNVRVDNYNAKLRQYGR
jgi:cytoskeletal protein RodZ